MELCPLGWKSLKFADVSNFKFKGRWWFKTVLIFFSVVFMNSFCSFFRFFFLIYVFFHFHNLHAELTHLYINSLALFQSFKWKFPLQMFHSSFQANKYKKILLIFILHAFHKTRHVSKVHSTAT